MENLNLDKECEVCCKKVDKILYCSKCKLANYCGKECQIKNWPEHKQVCHVLLGFPKSKYAYRMLVIPWIKQAMSIVGVGLNSDIGLCVLIIEKEDKKVDTNTHLFFTTFRINKEALQTIKINCRLVLVKYIIWNNYNQDIRFTCVTESFHQFMFQNAETNNRKVAKEKAREKLENYFLSPNYKYQQLENNLIYLILKERTIKVGTVNEMMQIFCLAKGESKVMDRKYLEYI